MLLQVAAVAGQVLWGLLALAVYLYTLNAFLEHRSGRRFAGAGPYASRRLCAAVFGGVLISLLSMCAFVLSLTVPDWLYLGYVRPYGEVLTLLTVAGIYAMIQASTSKERTLNEAATHEERLAQRRRQLKETLVMRDNPDADDEEIRMALGRALLVALELWQQWWTGEEAADDDEERDDEQ